MPRRRGRANSHVSSSLSTTELFPAGSETLLRYTEHTAFLDGKDDSAGRRQGCVDLLEVLANELATHD